MEGILGAVPSSSQSVQRPEMQLEKGVSWLWKKTLWSPRLGQM